MRNRIIRLPVRASTLTNKIRKDNPWKSGETLASVFEYIWYRIQDCNGLTRPEFCDKLSTDGMLFDWCKHHYLSPYYVAWKVAEEYL